MAQMLPFVTKVANRLYKTIVTVNHFYNKENDVFVFQYINCRVLSFLLMSIPLIEDFRKRYVIDQQDLLIRWEI